MENCEDEVSCRSKNCLKRLFTSSKIDHKKWFPVFLSCFHSVRFANKKPNYFITKYFYIYIFNFFFYKQHTDHFASLQSFARNRVQITNELFSCQAKNMAVKYSSLSLLLFASACEEQVIERFPSKPHLISGVLSVLAECQGPPVILLFGCLWNTKRRPDGRDCGAPSQYWNRSSFCLLHQGCGAVAHNIFQIQQNHHILLIFDQHFTFVLEAHCVEHNNEVQSNGWYKKHQICGHWIHVNPIYPCFMCRVIQTVKDHVHRIWTFQTLCCFCKFISVSPKTAPIITRLVSFKPHWELGSTNGNVGQLVGRSTILERVKYIYKHGLP